MVRFCFKCTGKVLTKAGVRSVWPHLMNSAHELMSWHVPSRYQWGFALSLRTEAWV